MQIKTMVTGLAAGIALFLCAGAWASDAPMGTFAAKGEQTCLKCHDDAKVGAVLKTPHAMKGDSRTPFANHGCESCHGASPEHVASAAKVKGDEKPVAPAVMFNGPNISPVEDRNAVCAGCHDDGLQKAWKGSQHNTAQVACTNCHTVHAAKDPTLVKDTQPQTCFTCHAQQRAESFLFSHHPVREGKIVCADCHNPHGSRGPKLLKELTLNQTCFNCHADKRGPLLFEHEPVREDCSLCHTSHGSMEARLLKQRVPFLCVSCHTNVGGPLSSSSGMTAGGQTLVLGNFGRNGSNASHGGTRGCMNCHVQIHGSNSPVGEALIR